MPHGRIQADGDKQVCGRVFRASTAASKMKVEVPNKQGVPRPVSKQISEVWLAHPERRSVATQTFRPGQPEITQSPNGRIALNTWSGFAFSPPPVDWEMHAEPATLCWKTMAHATLSALFRMPPLLRRPNRKHSLHQKCIAS